MKKLINFLKQVHSVSGEASAKRFYGGIVVLTALVLICIYRHDVLYETLLTGCGLLGLGILDKLNK